MKKIVLATQNKGKIEEISQILKNLDVQVVSMKDIGYDEDIEETGITLNENAYLKAKRIFDYCQEIVLADDTGLFVESLGGAPGIYSARYAGEGCTPADNRKKMLAELEGINDRRAYFETVIAIVYGKDQVQYATGRVDGSITSQEMGTYGFGYDSIFQPNGYDLTFAQMSNGEKNRISHRSRALAKLAGLIAKLVDKQ